MGFCAFVDVCEGHCDLSLSLLLFCLQVLKLLCSSSLEPVGATIETFVINRMVKVRG